MYRIRTDIPHGNAAQPELVLEDGVPAVHFMAHPHGGTEALWWCMRLERDPDVEAPDTLRLVWEVLHQGLGLGPRSADRLHPVVRRDGGPWERLPAGETREREDGCGAAAWDLPAPRAWLEAAFCFPHGPDDVDAFAKAAGWRRDVIGASTAGRPLVRVANDIGAPNGRRPGVYAVSHQHASEMSGAWALHGFLAEMADRGGQAPLVWSVPVTNVDGCLAGDYGKDPFPWDLNRAWGHPPMRAEVMATMQDMARWRERCRPLLALDFHSPGGTEDAGVYTFLADPEKEPASHARGACWADRLAAGLGDWSARDFKRVARYPGRFVTAQHGNFTRFHNHGDPSLTAMTFEVPYHRIGERVLTIDDYLDIGRRMARTVCAHLDGDA